MIGEIFDPGWSWRRDAKSAASSMAPVVWGVLVKIVMGRLSEACRQISDMISVLLRSANGLASLAINVDSPGPV